MSCDYGSCLFSTGASDGHGNGNGDGNGDTSDGGGVRPALSVACVGSVWTEAASVCP
jgi:hypothetical protein